MWDTLPAWVFVGWMGGGGGIDTQIWVVFIINPRRMREGYGSRSVCKWVSVCVCYRASCYIPVLYVENKVPLGFSS